MVEWRTVPSFPWLEASSDGRLRRIVIALNGNKPREILGAMNRDGYVMVCIQRGQIRRGNIGKHVLICEAFKGLRPSPRHEVAHSDGNRGNNIASNLRWATRKENAADRERHGRTYRGGNHPSAKLNDFAVWELRRLAAEGFSGPQLAAMFDINRNHATRIISGKCWPVVTLESIAEKYDPDGRHRAFNAELHRCVALGVRISPLFSRIAPESKKFLSKSQSRTEHVASGFENACEQDEGA